MCRISTKAWGTGLKTGYYYYCLFVLLMENGFKARVQFASFISTIDLVLVIAISQSLTVLAPFSFCLGISFRQILIWDSLIHPYRPFRRMLVWTIHSTSFSWIWLLLGEVSIWISYIDAWNWPATTALCFLCLGHFFWLWGEFVVDWNWHTPPPSEMLFAFSKFVEQFPEHETVGALSQPKSTSKSVFSRRLWFLRQFHQLHLIQCLCFGRSRFPWRTCFVWDAVWRIRSRVLEGSTQSLNWKAAKKWTHQHKTKSIKKPWMREIMRALSYFLGMQTLHVLMYCAVMFAVRKLCLDQWLCLRQMVGNFIDVWNRICIVLFSMVWIWANTIRLTENDMQTT